MVCKKWIVCIQSCVCIAAPDHEEVTAWQSGQGAERDSWSLVGLAKQEQEHTEYVRLTKFYQFFF